jgi:5-methylcytosine-specific restriction protein A
MNEILLLLVPIVIIILSVCQKSKTYKALNNIFFYSKYIILFIPFILMYLKPDFQNKILRFFHEIDKKPMHQNMYDMMQSYIDTKNNNPYQNQNRNQNFYPPHSNSNYFQNTPSGQPIPMNHRANLINPKNFINSQAGGRGRMGGGGTRHKRNVSESKKKYIASSQKWNCAHCQQILDNTYEVDHVIPLYKGGTNDLTNLEALCRNCHGKKTFKDKLGI